MHPDGKETVRFDYHHAHHDVSMLCIIFVCIIMCVIIISLSSVLITITMAQVFYYLAQYFRWIQLSIT